MNFTLTNQNKIFNENKINVQNTLDSAVLHYQKGEFSAAQLLFKKTLKLEPNNELALMLSGLLAAQNKDAARIMRQMIKYPEKLQKVELDEIMLLMRDFLFVEFARMNIKIPDFVFELVPDFGEEEDS